MQMWQSIRNLVKGGSTVLLTTQYLDEADQLADNIVVIDKGRVVANDTPDGLKRSVGSSSLHLTVKDADKPPTRRRLSSAYSMRGFILRKHLS